MNPLYLIAEIYPRHDKLAEAHIAFQELIEQTRLEPGCLLYDLVIEDVGDHWLMLEKWESHDAWDQHMRTNHVKRIQELTPELSEKPTVLRFLNPVSEAVQF